METETKRPKLTRDDLVEGGVYRGRRETVAEWERTDRTIREIGHKGVWYSSRRQRCVAWTWTSFANFLRWASHRIDTNQPDREGE